MPSTLHYPDDDFSNHLEQCRNFLLAIANAKLPKSLMPKGGASDLVQETLAKAYLNRAQFSGRTLADLRAWLRAILNNELTDFRRWHHASRRSVVREAPLGPAGGIPDPGPSPESAMIATERDAGAADLFAGLSADAQQVIVLRIDDRLNFREIGDRLGKTEEASRKLFARTLDLLRSRSRDAAA